MKKTEKKLGHANVTMTTAKYSGDVRRKKRQELQDCSKSQPTRIFIREDLGIQVIMDCRTAQAVKFRKELGFNQQDPRTISFNDTRTISFNKIRYLF